MNGLKKSAKNRVANGMPSLPTGPTQVTKTGNVGSVDVFRAAHLSTFGPRGQGNALRVVNGLKNQQKIREANGMPSLPIVPIQVALRENVGSVDVFRSAHLSTFGPRGQGNALRGS